MRTISTVVKNTTNFFVTAHSLFDFSKRLIQSATDMLSGQRMLLCNRIKFIELKLVNHWHWLEQSYLNVDSCKCSFFSKNKDDVLQICFMDQTVKKKFKTYQSHHYFEVGVFFVFEWGCTVSWSIDSQSRFSVRPFIHHIIPYPSQTSIESLNVLHSFRTLKCYTK